MQKSNFRLICLLLSLMFACGDDGQKVEQNNHFNSEPRTFLLDTLNGYQVNLITGTIIQPFINSLV